MTQDLSLDARHVYLNAYLKTLLSYLVDVSNLTWQNFPPPAFFFWNLSSLIKWMLKIQLWSHSWILAFSHIYLIHWETLSVLPSKYKQESSHFFPCPLLPLSPAWIITVASYNHHHPYWKQMAYSNEITENLIKGLLTKVWTRLRETSKWLSSVQYLAS